MKEVQPQLSGEDKDLMEKLLSAGQIKHKYATRLQTVLLRAKGKGTADIAEFLGVHQCAVSRHINRYNAGGMDSLLRDKTRKPGTPPISQEQKNEMCRIACTEKPGGETHWSCRTLAKRVGIGKTAANRILNEVGLKPHLVKTRHYSNDPDFERKLTDVVGLCLNPPENAIVLCADEKTQIQALERAEPVLPMFRNVPERQSADYLRHGTTTLFAALDALTGNVIGECPRRHTGEDYIRFLKRIDKACRKGKALHIIADNLSAHKTQAVRGYVESEPGRFVLHFIPTHSSWLNLVERWLRAKSPAEITNKRIRRESWKSVEQLTGAIKHYIKTWNKSKRSFKWAKTPDEILFKIAKSKSPPIL